MVMKEPFFVFVLLLAAGMEATASPRSSINESSGASSCSSQPPPYQLLGEFNIETQLFSVYLLDDYCPGDLFLYLSFRRAGWPTASEDEQYFEARVICKNRTIAPYSSSPGNKGYYSIGNSFGSLNTKIFTFRKEGLLLSDCSQFEIRVAGKLHLFPIDH
jgi:hypothetical protein